MIAKNRPIPGSHDDKISAEFKKDDTTSAHNQMGFNHLPQVKGEKFAGPVAGPVALLAL